MGKKTKKHLLLLEPEQKEDWKKRASSAGMSLNKYIRSCVERRQITTHKATVSGEVIAQLSRIGSNLSQQTRTINAALKSGKDAENWEANLKAVEETASLLKHIQAQLMGLSVNDRENSKR